MPALAPGTRLGPYEILDAIGAGGMGEVYRGRDTRLDRVVAIKVLASGLASDPQSRERFEREAKAISSLNHPNICVLHDVGRERPSGSDEPPVDFLVMEYVEGETLSARLARGPSRASRNAVLRSVSVEPGASFVAGKPTVVAKLSADASLAYDVAPDGRFLFHVPASIRDREASRPQLVVVQNWFDELKARVPTTPRRD